MHSLKVGFRVAKVVTASLVLIIFLKRWKSLLHVFETKICCLRMQFSPEHENSVTQVQKFRNILVSNITHYPHLQIDSAQPANRGGAENRGQRKFSEPNFYPLAI